MAGVRNSVNITYRLSCGMYVMAPAFIVGGKLQCPIHDGFEEIADVLTDEWRAKCNTCSFARWAGQSRSNAEVFANGHRSRNRGHNVHTERTEHPEAKRTLQKREDYRIQEAGGRHAKPGP
jgi:hypothetical protein